MSKQDFIRTDSIAGCNGVKEPIYLPMRASQGKAVVKNLPANVDNVGWHPPRVGMVIHSTILCLRIPRTEEPQAGQSMGSQS